MDWKRETLTGSESWLLMLPGDRPQLAKMPSWARLGSRVPVRSIRHQQRPQTIIAPLHTENLFQSGSSTNAVPGNLQASFFFLLWRAQGLYTSKLLPANN
jgi:hypothetical protein